MGMRALASVLVVAAVAAVGSSAARRAVPPGRLTYVAWIERGGGTGSIASPSTLCEANGDGRNATRLSPRIGSFAEPAWTRDGARVVFATFLAGTGAVLQVSAASPWRPVTIARDARWPAWSPDGSRIAYVGPGGLVVAGAGGLAARTVAGGDVTAPSWSADGARILFARGGFAGPAGLFSVPTAGGAETMLSDEGRLPALSPDGARLAFVAPAPSAAPLLRARDELYVAAADGSHRVRLTSFDSEEPSGPTEVFLGRPAWSPDGSTIAVVRSVVFDGVKGPYLQKRNLFLLDASSGARSDASPPGAFGSPAWRPASALASADASRKPCVILGPAGGTIRGTAYDDLIHGSDRAETIRAGTGNDWVHAERGADTIEGGAGRDELWSGAGRDRVLARDGARDVVHCGDEGADSVQADASDALGGRCRRTR